MRFDDFLTIDVVEPHEVYLERGQLHKVDSTRDTVLFVSHQWMSPSHADAAGEQIRILQDGFRNLMSGQCKVLRYWVDAMMHKPPAKNTSPEWDTIFRGAYVWYDYLSIPQLADGPTCNLSSEDTKDAIASIANYVDQSSYFFILAPPLMANQGSSNDGITTHVKSEVRDHGSWASRGWCALELFAMAMKTDDAPKARTTESIIRVNSAHDMCFQTLSNLLFPKLRS
jgi:hypothetical protein